jgi:hypothetical protein
MSTEAHLAVGALRERMIEDMRVRGFVEKTRKDYVRHVRAFAAFIGRPPDTATAEELRRFQLKQTEDCVGVPTVNSAAAALRFLFTTTLERGAVELRVAEKDLDPPDVDVLLEQMGREAVPQRVRRDALSDARRIRRRMNGAVQYPGRHLDNPHRHEPARSAGAPRL